jgi:hypothetical protein
MVCERLGLRGEVLWHLADDEAELHSCHWAGDHRDDLRNVDDTAAGDAVVGLDQTASGEDVLHTPGKLLLVALVCACELQSMVPR